jgi:adenylate cyclase
MNRVLFILLIVLGLPLVFQSTPTEILKLKVFDYLVPEKEESGFFTILNITEEDVAREGGYPLPRQRLAEIHIELLQKGALGVGWVLSFPQPDRLGGDEVFAEALCYGGSVIGMFEDGSGNYPDTSGTVVLGNNNNAGIYSTGVVQNIDILKNCSNQGIAVAPTEVDNLVRRVPLMMKTPDGFVSAYGTEVMKVLAGNSTYIIKTNDNGIEEITVQGLAPAKTDTLGRKWISWVDTKQTTLEEMDVKGRYVFVGFTASGIMPQVATPVGLLEPHKIQAALSESILIQDSPYIPDWHLAAEILIFAIFVASVWLVINFLTITKGLGMLGVLLLSTGFLGAFSVQKGILLDFSWTFVSEIITSTVAFYLNYQKQYKLRQQIKKQFEHYLDPRQVKQLQDNPDLLRLGGEKKYCTFLFTDVRGFTNLSEKLEPEQVTEIMNKVLTAQVTCIQAHGGMVDKFIGDACMAIFNAPLDLDNHEERAVACAQDMRTAIKQLQKELPEPIAIGIGVNSGEAVIGNMGSDTRFDFSGIGDAINVAARLESATKEVGEDILIGHETAKSVDFSLKLLKPIKVKGKSKPLAIYTI